MDDESAWGTDNQSLSSLVHQKEPTTWNEILVLPPSSHTLLDMLLNLLPHFSHLLRWTNNVSHTLFQCKRKYLALCQQYSGIWTNVTFLSQLDSQPIHPSYTWLQLRCLSSTTALPQTLEYWEMTKENITGLAKEHDFYPEAKMELKEFKI